MSLQPSNDFFQLLNILLDKLTHIMESYEIAVHLIGVPKHLITIFQRWGVALHVGPGQPPKYVFRSWSILDEALDCCKTKLLVEMGYDAEQGDIEHTLFELGRRHSRTAELLALMKRRNLDVGEVLIKADDKAADVFILQSGHLSVHLPAVQGLGVRVRSLGPGAIVGEIGYLSGQPRNATVMSEGEVVVLCLSEATIRKVEKTDRDLAALLMSIFSRSLEAKLAQNSMRISYAKDAINARAFNKA